MLPENQFKKISKSLKTNISRTSKLLKISHRISLILGISCFSFAALVSIIVSIWGKSPEPIIDPNSGSVSFTQSDIWFQKIPTESIFILGFLFLLVYGATYILIMKQKRKELLAKVDPTQLIRDFMLSDDKDELESI